MDEPKTVRGRQTRDAIIETAAGLMYARGVRATTLDDVLKAAGCGKSQLYHYFDDRRGLLAAVVDYQLELILDHQARFKLDTWSGLRAWFDALVARQQQQSFRGCPLGSLIAEFIAEDGALREVSAAAFARWQQTLAVAFEQMRLTGRLSESARPNELARHVLSAIQGGYLLSTVQRDPEPMSEALNAAFQHLRNHR